MNNYKDIYLRAQELETSNPQESIRLLKMANYMVLRNYNPVNYNLLMRLPRLLKKLNQHELATQEEERYKQINFYFKKQKIQNHWIDLFKKHGSFSIEIKAGSLYQPCSLHQDVWGRQIDANQQTWDLYIEPLYTVPECKCWLVYNLYSTNNVANAKPTARQSALEKAKQKLLQKRTLSNQPSITQQNNQKLLKQLPYNNSHLLEYQTEADYNNNFDDVITVKNNAVYNYNANESIAQEIQDLQDKVNNFINTIDTLPVPASKVFTVTDNSTSNSTSVSNFTVDNSALNNIPSHTVSNAVSPIQHNVAGNNPFNTITSANNALFNNINVAINPPSKQVSITNNATTHTNASGNSASNSFSSFAQNLNNLFIGNNNKPSEFKTYISSGANNKQNTNNVNLANSNLDFANASTAFVAKSIYTYANSNVVLDTVNNNGISFNNTDTKIAEDNYKQTQELDNSTSSTQSYTIQNTPNNQTADESIIKDYGFYTPVHQYASNVATENQNNYQVFNSNVGSNNNETIIADVANTQEDLHINTNVPVSNTNTVSDYNNQENTDTTIVNHEENYVNNVQANYIYNLNNSNSSIVNDVENTVTEDNTVEDNEEKNYDYGTINYSNYTNNAVDLSNDMLLSANNSNLQTNSNIANDIVLDVEESSNLQIATASDVDLPVTDNSFVYKPRSNVIKDASAIELPTDNIQKHSTTERTQREDRAKNTNVNIASAHATEQHNQDDLPENLENNQQVAVKNNKKTNKLLWFVFFVLMVVNAILVKLKILS